MSKTNDRILSASRAKTLETCSWSYWCNYHLKIPQKKNEGAIRGTICHLILELLLKNGRKKYVNAILKKHTIEAIPSIARLVKKHLIEEGAFTTENYELCSNMIHTALNCDFYGKGGKLLDPETEFLIDNKNPEYKIRGFIDKTVKYSKEKKIKIIDYKTSKVKFKGEELDSNIQAMAYTLAAKQKWPDYDIEVEFQFLKFPRQPLQNIKINDAQLEGFQRKHGKNKLRQR